MGTNYYVKTETCPTCGHKPEEIHLGKSSIGWTFSFQYNGGNFYKNVQEMKEWLKDKKIEDEYGRDISHDDFWKMVKRKQKEKNCHARDYPGGTEMLIDGYSFSDTWFC